MRIRQRPILISSTISLCLGLWRSTSLANGVSRLTLLLRNLLALLLWLLWLLRLLLLLLGLLLLLLGLLWLFRLGLWPFIRPWVSVSFLLLLGYGGCGLILWFGLLIIGIGQVERYLINPIFLLYSIYYLSSIVLFFVLLLLGPFWRIVKGIYIPVLSIPSWVILILIFPLKNFLLNFIKILDIPTNLSVSLSFLLRIVVIAFEFCVWIFLLNIVYLLINLIGILGISWLICNLLIHFCCFLRNGLLCCIQCGLVFKDLTSFIELL